MVCNLYRWQGNPLKKPQLQKGRDKPSNPDQKKKKNRRKGKIKQNQKKSSSIVQGFGTLTQWFCSRRTGRPNATAVFVQILYNTQAHPKDNSSSVYCNTLCHKFSNFLMSGCLYALKNWELQRVFFHVGY